MTDKNYIIGYGSLMSMQSVLKTLRNLDVSKIGVLPVIVYGMERGWFVRSSRNDFTALGVIKNSASKFNGTLIGPLSRRQIYELDKRERKYKRIKIRKENIKITKQNISVLQNDIWIYVIKNKKMPTNECPVIQTYVDVVINGSFKISENFTKEFIKTTTNWNSAWVNDRKNPIYQRSVDLLQKEEKKVDKIFKITIPKEFKMRKTV